MGFNSAFKGLIERLKQIQVTQKVIKMWV